VRRGLRPLALAALAALAGVAPSAGAGAGTADARAAARGAAWLAGAAAGAPGGQRADAIVAMAAAGRTPARLRRPLAGLARVAPAYGKGAGPAAKVALAASAAGADPERFGGVDYIARVNRAYAAGRYGATAYDQALSMLALEAAGQPVPPAAVRALRAARGAGGWGFDLRPGETDDASTTGLLIEALRAAGVPARDPALRAATAWMLRQRNADGGWGFGGPASPTEANSTAIAVRALRAMGRRPPANARALLRGLQDPDGAFRFRRDQPGSPLLATTDVVIALAGRTLPPPFGRSP
jgi:hypothetical protein